MFDDESYHTNICRKLVMSASPVSPIRVVDDSDPVLGELADVPPAPPEIIEALAQVPDPRDPRGVRHGLREILTIAAAAVLAGAQSFAAIGDWATDAGTAALQALGVDAGVPSESTIRRTLERVDAEKLDAIVNAWMMLRFTDSGGRRIVAVDGKTLRGSVDADGHRPHLLAAMDHESGAVIGQVDVGAKTNEIPRIIDLLDPIDITDMIITVDAMHTQRATADYITGRGGHVVMTVKRNQCATRRSDTFPLQAGQTRREVCWVRWLTWIRKGEGNKSMSENRWPGPGAWDGVSGDPHGMAKA